MRQVTPTPLPIDGEIPRIRELLDARGSLVLVAPPGSGKTTRVPPALLGAGPLILLQPRRVAARSIARRIADEQGFEVGREVGWQVRFDRRYGNDTRLLVATEGILTARLQADPLLSGFATVILDEFHERSVHADLALALVAEAKSARGDLRIVVMSATLDAGPVAEFLGGAPVVEVAGRPFDVGIEYAPHDTVTSAVRRVLARAEGHVLCFLPGAGEIRQAERELAPLAGDALVLPLHGSLDSEAQDRALAPASTRKIVLATNIAETSLTIDGVTEVVDSGLVKVMRFDPETGLDHLATERVSAASALQRAGRAGRTAPGRATRLFDARERLRPHREADIHRIDLSGPLLEVLAWGGDLSSFRWFESPPRDRVEAALRVLCRLGAVEDGRLTDLGRALHRMPLPPRLARFVLEVGGGPRASRVAAALSERRVVNRTGEPPTTDSDVLALVDRWSGAPGPMHVAAREIESIARGFGRTGPSTDDEASIRRALFHAFPDRVARRRSPNEERLLLARGQGARLGRESGVRSAEYLVALDVTRSSTPGEEVLVRMASAVDRGWIEATSEEVVHRYDAGSRSVRASVVERYDELALSERAVAPDPVIAGAILTEVLRVREPDDELRQVLLRLRFADLHVDLDAAVARACMGQTRLPDLGIEDLLDHAGRAQMERLAPASIPLPSGRRAKADCREMAPSTAEVKLQELFGLETTPLLGPKRVPLTLSLVAQTVILCRQRGPANSSWNGAYVLVRKSFEGATRGTRGRRRIDGPRSRRTHRPPICSRSRRRVPPLV